MNFRIIRGVRADQMAGVTSKNSINMTEGKPVALIMSFALPLIFGNIFQHLYAIVDSVIVGHGIGLNALAAVGASDWLHWFISWSIQGLTVGFAVLVAHRVGARDVKGIKKTVAMSTILCVIIGVILTLFSEILALPALKLLGTPDSLIDGSYLYLAIIYGGILITIAYNMAAGILRSVGDSRSPMLALVVAAFANISLDLIFVLVFHWGIAGAAVATLTAQLSSFLFCLLKMRKHGVLSLEKEDFKIDRFLCRELLKQGIPNAGSFAVIAVGGMIVQSAVNANEEAFVAGFTATMKLNGIMECVSLAIGSAMSTYVGQNLGAGKIPRIREGIKKMMPIILCIGVILGALMIVFGRPLLRLFISGDTELAIQSENIGYNFLIVMSALQWLLFALNVHRMSLQGIGKSGVASISGIIELICRSFFVVVLVRFVHLHFIYLAEESAWVGAGIYLIVMFYYHLRKIEKEYEKQKSI